MYTNRNQIKAVLEKLTVSENKEAIDVINSLINEVRYVRNKYYDLTTTKNWLQQQLDLSAERV